MLKTHFFFSFYNFLLKKISWGNFKGLISSPVFELLWHLGYEKISKISKVFVFLKTNWVSLFPTKLSAFKMAIILGRKEVLWLKSDYKTKHRIDVTCFSHISTDNHYWWSIFLPTGVGSWYLHHLKTYTQGIQNNVRHHHISTTPNTMSF